jgi:hypothetical protein
VGAFREIDGTHGDLEHARALEGVEEAEEAA